MAMSVPFRKATDADLLKWLDEAPARLERYIEKHPEAAIRLDELTEFSPAMGTHLEAALAPAEDFRERMLRAVTPSPKAGETPALLLDMLTLPWRTASVLVDPKRIQGAE
jgi:hypothetical protein